MNHNVSFTLSYEGNSADQHEIDLYDVAQALMGFQRSIALTTHLVLNDKIITKAPYLKGAKVYALPPEEGSWSIKAGVLIAGISTAGYQLGTAPKDTPLGHLVHSAYDYVISESLGFHVDYDKSLGQQYEELQKKEIAVPVIEQYQLDSLIEKCSTAITEMHRPIFKTNTAESAQIYSIVGREQVPFESSLSIDTYEYMHEEYTENEAVVIEGRISSYNSNTYKGRVYVRDEGRPVSFELTPSARDDKSVKLIVASLSENALGNHDEEWSVVYCLVYRNRSKAGYLKSYTVMSVDHTPTRIQEE